MLLTIMTLLLRADSFKTFKNWLCGETLRLCVQHTPDSLTCPIDLQALTTALAVVASVIDLKCQDAKVLFILATSTFSQQEPGTEHIFLKTQCELEKWLSDHIESTSQNTQLFP